MSEYYPRGWFGPTWNAPVNEDSRHLDTPFGEKCMACHKEFVEGDQGLTIPGVHEGSYDLQSIHIACFAGMVME